MIRDHGVQRRRLTIMFCDLVNSTELSAVLDPEELLQITNTCLRHFAKCAEDAGGFVARYSGDGVLVYFGYPQASEDDASRAVNCALAIRDRRSLLWARVGRTVGIRIGIATGPVVVGDLIGTGPSQEYTVAGKTPNLAARLQSAAASNGILVCGETRKLCAHLFRFQSAGSVALKGLPYDTEVWTAVGPNAVIDGLQKSPRHASSKMVGRTAELACLLELLRRGDGGHVVGVIGEPGIGKSRLLEEVRNAIGGTRCVWLESRGVQILKDTPFYVAAQILRQDIRNDCSAGDTGKTLGLATSLRAGGMNDEDLSLLTDLLGEAQNGAVRPPIMRPKEKRRRLISTLVTWLLNAAARAPTVLIIEDLQWVDPSTIEFLGALARQMRPAAFHLMYTARENINLQLPAGLPHKRIKLAPLPDEECRLIVGNIFAGRLGSTMTEKVALRSQGVPLFAEELARHMLEHGGNGVSEIPDTLSILLTVRIQQLGDASSLVRIASVLGMEFPLPLLRSVFHKSLSDFQSALQKLIDIGMLLEHEESGSSILTFRHALIRDAAYDGLLKSKRRELHREIATKIAEHFCDHALAGPQVLAQHWAAAGDTHRAVDAWREAGRSASSRHAYTEAQRAYETAIALVGDLPESQRRDQRELELRSALAGVLQITTGYSAPETIAATEIAHQLAGKMGDLRKHCAHIAGAWMAASSSGDYALAVRLADQLMPFALAEMSPGGLGIAYMIQMTSRYRTGNLVGAEESFSAGSAFFASVEFRQRPGAAAQTFGNAAINAWLLEEMEEARCRRKTCLDVCLAGTNPYDLAFGQQMAAMNAVLMNELEAARGLAEQSMLCSDQNGFPQFAAISRIVIGRAETQLGNLTRGMPRIQEGIRRMMANGSCNGITMYLTWLADAQLADGNANAALATLDEALNAYPQELFFRPESLRLRAEAKWALGKPTAAVADCRGAVELARRMGAKIFHTRAAKTLGNFGLTHGEGEL